MICSFVILIKTDTRARTLLWERWQYPGVRKDNSVQYSELLRLLKPKNKKAKVINVWKSVCLLQNNAHTIQVRKQHVVLQILGRTGRQSLTRSNRRPRDLFSERVQKLIDYVYSNSVNKKLVSFIDTRINFYFLNYARTSRSDEGETNIKCFVEA